MCIEHLGNRRAASITRLRAMHRMAAAINNRSGRIDDGNHQRLTVTGLTERCPLAGVLWNAEIVASQHEAPGAAGANWNPAGSAGLPGRTPQGIVGSNRIEAATAEIEHYGP